MKKIVIIFLLFFNMSSIHASSKFKVTLDKCIDGDTARFNIKGEVKTVRFLSINAPEIDHDNVVAEPFGYEAGDYTCNLLKKASVIKLQYDTKSDKEDKYGRVLAWVFVDDVLLQEKLVSEGLAEVKYVYDDYLYSSDLKEVERIAKSSHKGMWGNLVHNSVDYSNFYYFFLIIFVIWMMYSLFKKVTSK